MRKPVKIFCRIFILLLTTLIVSCAHVTPQKNSNQYFESWPSGTSPQEIGKRVAERFVVTPHGGWGRTTPVKSIPYPETCTWYGAMTFANVTGDNDLKERIV